MTDSLSRRTSAATTTAPSIPNEYATLPANAPTILKKHTISIQTPSKIQAVVDDERRRNFQALVRRYMNQLLYGCQREFCDTPTCYTSRKRLSRNSSASRRLTLLSARIIACSLATQDDPLKALCPGKPVVPTLAAEKGGVQSRSIAGDLDDEEKENRPDGGDDRGRCKKGDPRQKEVSVVRDKGLKDTRSFTQQLFNTVAMKMVEWISLPPPNRSFNLSPQGWEAEERRNGNDVPSLSPQEPPKFKFPSNPMEVMDTGRLSRDSEPVSQIRHQEILQQPRKRGPSLKDVTPTPHSNTAKAKLSTPVSAFAMPPPPPPPLANFHHGHQGRKTATVVQITPSRGEKNTQTLWEPVEPVASPQSLKLLDEDICKALVDMCTNMKITAAQRRDAIQFAKQSIFYVFSTPEAALSSFGGIGDGESLDFNPRSIGESLDTLYKHGWEERVKRNMWMGLANVFAKPGKGMSDREAAGIIVLSLHVLASGLVKDNEIFRIVTELRASGKVSSPGMDIVPDIGLDDELAERLMKRVLRAVSFRRARPEDDTISHVKQYLRKCQELLQKERDERIGIEFGTDMISQVNFDAVEGGIGLARCTLEWTRAVFMRSWDGHEIVKHESLSGACVGMFELLYSDCKCYGLSPAIFETKIIGERINAYIWPVDWYNSVTPLPSPNDIHLLDHQYLFPVPHLVTFFRAINLDIMKKAYETAIANIRMAGQMSELTRVGYPALSAKIETALSIYFVLTVRRVNLLEDALNQLIHREHRELMRPLKIRFAEGEEGVDQGGVQQEFFSLLMTEILKPEYGMFVTDERTRLSWFCVDSPEFSQKFELVGLVMGLAVYNGITLPVNFPKALYIKLLGGTPTLDDIDDYWPELARGLKTMRGWEDGDVGDVFVRTYEYSCSVFGEVWSFNMLDPDAQEDFLSKQAKILEIKTTKPKTQQKKPKESSGSLNDWRLAIPDDTDGWLGGLSHILETLDAEETEDEARLRRLRSGQPRYTVSEHDLNATDAEAAGEIFQTEDTGSDGGFENENRIQEISDDSSGSFGNSTFSSGSSRSEHGVYTPDGGDSKKSFGIEEEEEDDVSLAGRVKLPSDDGEDWDDRSTVYSPTGSMYERDLEAQSLEFETQETSSTNQDIATKDQTEAFTIDSVVAIPFPSTRPATPSPDLSLVEDCTDSLDNAEYDMVIDDTMPSRILEICGIATESKQRQSSDGQDVEEAPLVNRNQYTTTPEITQEQPVKEAPLATIDMVTDDAVGGQILDIRGIAPESKKRQPSDEQDVEEAPREQYTTSPETTQEQPVKEAPLVINANREQYITDYITWLTDLTIRRQYAAFERGFFVVNSLRSLNLFDVTSFQALVEGQSGGNIDISELERVCKYEDGYHPNHRVIKDFWAVVKGFNDDKKRLLLEFVTSSARVPIGGLENVMFYIVRNGEDSERLPSSLTCFGRLLLPEYSSKKKLKQKLSLALENGKGFGNP
ncbi:HECT-domain-containing protein [Wilcoxina mikolae CBS 423.85]|nr:HECT-domain-containing protein [Wilcoxina mikolae CBS 423.85]